MIAAVPSEQVVREQRTDREELGEWVCINKALDRNHDRRWSITERTGQAADTDRWAQHRDIAGKKKEKFVCVSHH